MIVLRPNLLRCLTRRIVKRGMSTEASDEEVLFADKGKDGEIGMITLNKPKALNALNMNMVTLIYDKLDEWSRKKQLIMIQGRGKAFCAGGDVVAITKDGPDNPCKGMHFFRKEYSLDYMINQLPIPYVAIIHGVTMGGGVGLSVHGKLRVATENSVFAMPETAIGLFPDIGGSYFLSRMPGGLGTYLALTGHRLKGADLVSCGVATHYIESSKIPYLMDAIENKITPAEICNELSSYTMNMSSHKFSLENKRVLIDSIFTLPTVEDIIEALVEEGSEWAVDTRKTLLQMSPTSLKISLKELQKGKKKSLKECLEMEYRLACAALLATISPDFYEGVQALLVRKDKKPKWNPPTLKDVSDDMVEEIFKIKTNPLQELNLPAKCS